MSDDKVYKDGDVVWVKLGNYWWPAEVTGEHRQPEGLVKHLKRKPYCVVKFFQEDSYEYVKSSKLVFPFQCDKKEDFIKKGIALHAAKNKFMEKFPSDVEIAENITRQARGSNTLIINDRPDSIVKAILRQSPANGNNDYYDREYLPNNVGNNIRRRDSVTKILNITSTRANTSSSDTNPIIPSDNKNLAQKSVSIGGGTVTTLISLSTLGNSAPLYACNICGLTSNRQNVMILHRKSHSSGISTIPATTLTFAPPKPSPKATMQTKTTLTPSSTMISTPLKNQINHTKKSKRASTPFPRRTLQAASPVSDLSEKASKSNRRLQNNSLIKQNSSSFTKSADSSHKNGSRRTVEALKINTKISKAKRVSSLPLNKRKLRSSPHIPTQTSDTSLDTNTATSEISSSKIETAMASTTLASTAMKQKCNISMSTPKCNTEEIRRRLLADWSDEEKDDEDEQSLLEKSTSSRGMLSEPLDDVVEIKNTESSTKSDDFDVKIIEVSPANFGITSTSTSNRVRNIPKKDRRDIVMKDFNSELISNSSLSVVPVAPPFVTIDSANSNSDSSDSVVVVDVVQPKISETIDLDQIAENCESIEIKPEDSASPVAVSVVHEGKDVLEIKSLPAAHASVAVVNEGTTVLSCFDFQDEENDTDTLASIANFKKKYYSPEKGQLTDGDSEDMKPAPQDAKHNEVQLKDQQLSADIDFLLEQTTAPTALKVLLPPLTQAVDPIGKDDASVRGLPIKERGKRIFKSRNKSRTEEIAIERSTHSNDTQGENEQKEDRQGMEPSELVQKNPEENINDLISIDNDIHGLDDIEKQLLTTKQLEEESPVEQTDMVRDNADNELNAFKVEEVVHNNDNKETMALEHKSRFTNAEKSHISCESEPFEPKRTIENSDLIEETANDFIEIDSANTLVSATEENSSLGSSEAEAVFGSPASALGEDRLSALTGNIVTPLEDNAHLPILAESNQNVPENELNKTCKNAEIEMNSKVASKHENSETIESEKLSYLIDIEKEKQQAPQSKSLKKSMYNVLNEDASKTKSDRLDANGETISNKQNSAGTEQALRSIAMECSDVNEATIMNSLPIEPHHHVTLKEISVTTEIQIGSGETSKHATDPGSMGNMPKNVGKAVMSVLPTLGEATVNDRCSKLPLKADDTLRTSKVSVKSLSKRRPIIKFTPRRRPSEIGLKLDHGAGEAKARILKSSLVGNTKQNNYNTNTTAAEPMNAEESSEIEITSVTKVSLLGKATPGDSRNKQMDSVSNNEEIITSDLFQIRSTTNDIKDCGNKLEQSLEKCVYTEAEISARENMNAVDVIPNIDNSTGAGALEKGNDIVSNDAVSATEAVAQVLPSADNEIEPNSVSVDVGRQRTTEVNNEECTRSELSEIDFTPAVEATVQTTMEKVHINVDVANPLSSQIANILANSNSQQQRHDSAGIGTFTKKRMQSCTDAALIKRKKSIEDDIPSFIIERPPMQEDDRIDLLENSASEQTEGSQTSKGNQQNVQEQQSKPYSSAFEQKTVLNNVSILVGHEGLSSDGCSQGTTGATQRNRKSPSKSSKHTSPNEGELYQEELQRVELHKLQSKMRSKKQIGTDSRGNKVVIIKGGSADMILQPLSVQQQIVTNQVAGQNASLNVGPSVTISSINAKSPTQQMPEMASPSKPKSPAAAATGGRKQAGHTITLPSSITVKQQQQKLLDDINQVRNFVGIDAHDTPQTAMAMGTSSKILNRATPTGYRRKSVQRQLQQAKSEEMLSQDIESNATATVYQRLNVQEAPSPAKISKTISSGGGNFGSGDVTLVQQQLLQLQQRQQQQRAKTPPPLHHLHNRKPRKQPQQHRSPQKKSSTSASDLNIIANRQQSETEQTTTTNDIGDLQQQTVCSQSPSQVSVKQTINSASFSEEQLSQIQADDLDGTAKILAVPTHPIRGYNETFLLCTLVNNNYKPIDNIPLYLDHDLNQLVPVPLEVLDSQPSLIVNHPPADESTLQLQVSAAEQLNQAQLMKSNSPKATPYDSSTQLVCLQSVVGSVDSSGTAAVSNTLLEESSADTDSQMAVFIPNENVADNAIILNIEGQQIILDAATFAHLLANPDANTQLITDDGTEFVLTRDVLAALEAQHVSQNVSELSQEQLQQQLEFVAANAQQLPAEAGSTDILAVALAGTELYGSEMLQIETSQGLQDLIGTDGNIVFQPSTLSQAHLTPPITAHTSETNALLNQTPIMSTLEKPSTAIGKFKHADLLSNASNNPTAALLATSVASDHPVCRPNLEDSLAVIGVTTQSSLELPITVTNPAIAPKAPLGPPPDIVTFQSSRALLPGQETSIYNDPGS